MCIEIIDEGVGTLFGITRDQKPLRYNRIIRYIRLGYNKSSL